MYICASLCVHVYMCMHVCVCRPEDFRDRVSLNLELIGSATLTGQSAPEVLLPLPPRLSTAAQACAATLCVMWVLGDRIQVLMLVWWTLTLSHLSVPFLLFFSGVDLRSGNIAVPGYMLHS